MPPLYCRCGNPVPREMHPGAPRRYCSTGCRQGAANQRRPVSPAIAALEREVRKAEQAAQAAWAEKAAADAKATSARRQADEAKRERYQQEFTKARPMPTSVYNTASHVVNPEAVAQAEVSRVLAMVDQLYAALKQHKADPASQHLREELERQLKIVRADPLGDLEIAARDAERGGRNRALAAASEAQEAVNTAQQGLSIAKRRLKRRAEQARLRRARAAGVEPEAQDVHQVDVARARQDPDYAAWLRRQGLL